MTAEQNDPVYGWIYYEAFGRDLYCHYQYIGSGWSQGLV